jgi:hypothetical protein
MKTDNEKRVIENVKKKVFSTLKKLLVFFSQSS